MRCYPMKRVALLFLGLRDPRSMSRGRILLLGGQVVFILQVVGDGLG